MINFIENRRKVEENRRKVEENRRKMEEHKKKIIIYNENVKKINIYNKLNINYNFKNINKNIIPLNFYTCWHTKDLPPLMRKNYNLLVQNNPEFSHFLYDENDCREFIKNNFEENVLNAYNSLIPCSYKSDLWRFCVLYINGGIYMDIKYQCTNNFKLIDLTDEEYFVRDRPQNCVYTALIVSKPQNNIMLNCINQIVKNIKNNYYGNNSLDPTGPGLLGSYFSLDYINNLKIYFTDTIIENVIEQDYIVYNNSIILKYYPGYREEQKQNQKNKYYTELWKEKKIYKYI